MPETRRPWLRLFEYAHNTESPILSRDSETELSAVVNLVYLAARDKYRVEREDKAGKGYVDFIFYPERKGADAFILELKSRNQCRGSDAGKGDCTNPGKRLCLAFLWKTGRRAALYGKSAVSGDRL